MSTFNLAGLPTLAPSRPFGAGILDDEPEVHHGDEFCEACDSWHSPVQPPAPLRRGPSSDDLHFEMGYSAVIEAEDLVEAPAGLSSHDRLSFMLGVAAGATEHHAREIARFEAQRELSGLDDEADCGMAGAGSFGLGSAAY